MKVYGEVVRNMPTGWMPDARHDLRMRTAYKARDARDEREPGTVHHLHLHRPHPFRRDRRPPRANAA